jgi:hypothetical protein
VTAWTLAPVLDRIRDEVTSRWPGTVFGTIGDAAHQLRDSDHNPDADGDVNALDIMTKSKAEGDTVAAGLVARAVAGALPLSYVIWNRTIWSSSHGWKPRPYTGASPHTDHVHVSAVDEAGAGTGGGFGLPSLPNPLNAAGDLVDGLLANAGKLAVMGALLAGGLALVVLGLYRGVAVPIAKEATA